MFHHESWKLTCFGVKRSKVKVKRHNKRCRRKFLHPCECWLLLIFFYIVNLVNYEYSLLFVTVHY